MRKISKYFSVVRREVIKKEIFFNVDAYIRHYTNYLKKIGINFTGTEKKVKFIDPYVWIDGTDYSLISIGDNVTISREVIILCHDYSINTAFCTIGKKIDRHEGEVHFRKPVSIGDNCFIGARATLLPGTIIGDNCIVGACSVVKGKIPNDSIVVGNPAMVIGSTNNYAKRHFELHDYMIEK